VLRHKLWGAEITLYEWDHRMSDGSGFRGSAVHHESINCTVW
jgi:hypothetical protein